MARISSGSSATRHVTTSSRKLNDTLERVGESEREREERVGESEREREERVGESEREREERG